MSPMSLIGKPEPKVTRPYKKPVLQHLGSVRELTLGGLTVSAPDGTGTKRMSA